MLGRYIFGVVNPSSETGFRYSDSNQQTTVSVSDIIIYKPFVRIVIICDTKKYCVFLSPPKYKDSFRKIDVSFTRIKSFLIKNQE